MKKALFILTILFSALASNAQNWEWMKGASDSGSDNGESKGMHVAVDKYGDVYQAGIIWFNGHIGPFTFSAGGGTSDIALVKYKNDGHPSWALFGGPKVFTQGLAADPFGNMYISGVYHDTALLLGGQTLMNPLSPDSLSSFIAKVDSGGNILWLKNVGNIRNAGYTSSYGNCIGSDKCGNLYFSTVFTKDFIVSNNSFGIVGGYDIFVAKYDTSGAFIWGKVLGGVDREWLASLSVTPSGNIYIGGITETDTLIIADTLLSNNVFTNMFVAKMDSSGNELWSRTNSGHVYGFTSSLKADDNDDVYVVGGYDCYTGPSSAISFGSLTLPVVEPLLTYAFVLKYDGAGNEIWAKCIRSKNVFASNVSISCENVWISGFNSVSANSIIVDTIDGNILAFPLKNNGSSFLAGWDNSGNYISSIALATGTLGSHESGLVSNNTGSLYFSGCSAIDTLFINNDSLYNPNGHTGFGGFPYNMFVAKYNTGFNCQAPQYAPCWPASASNIFKNTEPLIIYPNPASNELLIETELTNYNTSLINTLGQLVYQKHSCNGKQTLDVSNLADGMYYLKVETPGNKTETKKVMIQH